jgi:two-component system, NtrC family, response regulator GlrR
MSDPSPTQFFLPQVGIPPALSLKEFFLDLTEGPDAGKSVGPLVPPVRIGSARGNDLVIADSTVSRFHCAIERGPDGPIIVDTGSKNGTFLGSYRVRDAYLQEGAVIRMGKTALAVRIAPGIRTVEVSSRKSFGGLIGESYVMRALFATLGRLAVADVPVLIEGETGSGKELVARALHSEGTRKDQPFVVVDCGAVAPSLVESELFGHVKGAFTGAEASRNGAFELANGGTLLLDEIGELPLPLQPKLLRVIETGMIKPLGAAREVAVAVRVLAATHRNLRQMVNETTFREDLYFRLAVLPVRVPPLRERPEDVAVLARHFFARAVSAALPALPVAELEAPTLPELTPESVSILRAQPWPGNVRELKNVLERAVIVGDQAAVARGDLADTLRAQVASERRGDLGSIDLEEAKRRFEREYLIKLLARHQDDLKKAAEEADIHPKSLQRLIRRHNLRGGSD